MAEEKVLPGHDLSQDPGLDDLMRVVVVAAALIAGTENRTRGKLERRTHSGRLAVSQAKLIKLRDAINRYNPELIPQIQEVYP